ncbi:hypothetical protein FPHYL_8548, partial [Fusarium phyllophilum]
MMPPENMRVLKVEDFEEQIKACKNSDIARNRVIAVIQHFDTIKHEMPVFSQDKFIEFLKTEKWVADVPQLSRFRLYRILKGTGRRPQLHFGMWLVVSAIWPGNEYVLGIADEMSKHWGVQFRGTAPWFPSTLSDDYIAQKWDGHVHEAENQPTDNTEGTNGDENVEGVNDNSDDNADDRKRRAEVLDEAAKHSTPKKQKTSGDEDAIDYEGRTHKETQKLYVDTVRHLLKVGDLWQTEKHAREQLAHENGQLQDIIAKHAEKIKQLSSENEMSKPSRENESLADLTSQNNELMSDNLVKSQIITRLRDELLRQKQVFENKQSKYNNIKAQLENTKAQQENTKAQLKNTESQLNEAKFKQENTKAQLE